MINPGQGELKRLPLINPEQGELKHAAFLICPLMLTPEKESQREAESSNIFMGSFEGTNLRSACREF